MARFYAAKELEWKGTRLIVQGGGRNAPSAEIVPDGQWPDMWRVKRPDGSVTDMVNLSRARDAAKAILLTALNSQETGLDGPPVHSTLLAAE